MKKFVKGFVGLSLLFLAYIVVLNSNVNAQANNRCHRAGVNQRQERQQNRIANGVESGALTAAEAARIERGEARINRQEARFRASGNGLSMAERARLERELNQTSRAIYRQSHDPQHQ